MRDLKELNKDREKLELDIAGLEAERRELQRRLGAIKNEISFQVRGLTISPHALLRYAQRIFGFDIETIKADLDSRILKLMRGSSYLGDGAYIQDGIKLIVRNATVVTVIDLNEQEETKA